MKNKKGEYYKKSRPGDDTIILCTESSDGYTFCGVCIRKGNETQLGQYSTKWNSTIFTHVKYNDKSIEEKINEELLVCKQKMCIFNENTAIYMANEKTVKLLEKLIE